MDLDQVAAEMLAEELGKIEGMTLNSIKHYNSEIKKACKRFTDRWTGIADRAIPIAIDLWRIK